MQVNEAFSVRKIEGSLKTSAGVMKDVNTLIRIPELTGTMRELSMELMKAGIIEEMVGDALPDEEGELGLDDELEEEVDKVLDEVVNKGKEKDQQLPGVPLKAPVQSEPVETEEEEEDALDDMRKRLAILKS